MFTNNAHYSAVLLTKNKIIEVSLLSLLSLVDKCENVDYEIFEESYEIQRFVDWKNFSSMTNDKN